MRWELALFGFIIIAGLFAIHSLLVVGAPVGAITPR
jgi:hypothetical protein